MGSICLHFSNFIFTTEKGELTILNNKAQHFGNYGHNEFCEATNRKIYFLIIMAICQATQKICFLTTSHGYLPSPSYTTFFLMMQALVTCCRRRAGRNHSAKLQCCRNRALSLNRRQIHDCVTPNGFCLFKLLEL